MSGLGLGLGVRDIVKGEGSRVRVSIRVSIRVRAIVRVMVALQFY